MPKYIRLSPQDASFIYAESPVAHMHVGSLAIFEDSGLSQEELNRHIDRRLDQIPQFRRKLKEVLYGLGRPVWVDDPNFDVRYHVRHAGLSRPGGEKELLTLVGRLMSMRLDRKRPLWELWLVDLPGKRKAIIQKTHHALIDGISGVDLATVLLDFMPEADSGAENSSWAPEAPPNPLVLLRDSVIDQIAQPVKAVQSVAGVLRSPARLWDQVATVGKGVASFGREALDVAPRTSLSKPIGGHRRFDIVRASLADVKQVKNAAGCTVNDVVLGLVAGGLRHLLLSRGDEVEGLTMRAAVPVSVRDESQRMKYGNQVAVLFADLPVGEADPATRLARVAEQMAHVKESREAVGAEALIKLADFAPPTILSLGSQAIFSRQWVINLTVTNVPGPQFPLYFRGGKMLEVFPFVPLLNNTPVGIAVLSYDGQLSFGLSGDWDAMADMDTLAEGITECLAAHLGRKPQGYSVAESATSDTNADETPQGSPKAAVESSSEG